MGYTHYWTQTRDFTEDEWADIVADVKEILKDVEHNQGIALANGLGKRGSSPTIDNERIQFNGLVKNSHETFDLPRIRPPKKDHYPDHGWDFCKTARKPYDLAVTATLCYLATITCSHEVTSDGSGSEWLEGLEEARRALPRYSNQLDIPMPILQGDRWCMPWISHQPDSWEVHFCIDGFGYVIRTKDNKAYRFDSHRALSEFLDRTKTVKFAKGGKTGWGSYEATEENIWNAYGCFDQARHARIEKAQEKILTKLFSDAEANGENRWHQPPAFVRPGQFPAPEHRHYSFSEMLAAA